MKRPSSAIESRAFGGVGRSEFHNKAQQLRMHAFYPFFIFYSFLPAFEVLQESALENLFDWREINPRKMNGLVENSILRNIAQSIIPIEREKAVQMDIADKVFNFFLICGE